MGYNNLRRWRRPIHTSSLPSETRTLMAKLLRNSERMTLTVGLVLLLRFGGTSLAEEQGGKYVDTKYDFSVTVPEPWESTRLQGYTVPGVARTAYSRPGGASIVFFVQEPGRDFEPRFLVDESAKSIEKNLGATVQEKEVRSVAGKKAMWLIVEGNGTGGAIDGKGTVRTTQHWVAIPREKDVIVALLTSPTSEFPENRKTFEASLKKFVVGGKQTAAQSESK